MSLATEIAGKLNYLNIQDKVAVNAALPYSGYTQVSKKLDNFVFQTSSSFLNKVADKNRYVKFGDKIVDTYGPELVTNGDFSNGTTGWQQANTSIFTVQDNIAKVEKVGTNWWGGFKSSGAVYGTIGKTISVSLFVDNPYNVNIKVYIGGTSNGIVVTGSGLITTSFMSIQDGDIYVTFNSSSGLAGEYFIIDNISVREIQTADFTNTVPEVSEIITNGSNTTSVSVNAGDYVVDGSELVTAISGTTTDSQPVANNALIVGRSYIVTGDCSGLTTGTYKISLGGSIAEGVNQYTVSSNGHFSKKLVLNSVPTQDIYVVVAGGFDGEVSNLSVRRVSDTFRAKQDAPIGTALTNTTYFEDRTQIGVTNQALAYHAYNTLTNSYEGIKTEVLFSDVSKEQLLDNSVWMANNGFSKVSEFLYSKGSYLCLPVGIWQSLNKGAYMPFVNGFGTDLVERTTDDNNARRWYESDAKLVDTLADCYLLKYEGTLGGTGSILKLHYDNGGAGDRIARPDSKYYDICYPDQFIDVREYSKIATDLELKLIRDDKEENGVEEVVFTEQVLQTTTGTVATLEVSNGANYKVGSVLQIWNGTTPYRRYIASVSGNTVTLDSTIVKTAVSFIIGGGRLPILSSGTSLSIDLIGQP